MRSTRFGLAIVAVALVASTSCSDATAPTSPATVTAASTPPFVTVSGMIHLAASPLDHVLLTAADGSDVILTGGETGLLLGLDKAEVDVRGIWNGDSLVVSDFLVRRVEGNDVMDGILTVIYDDEMQSNPVGYGISLNTGMLIPLRDPPKLLISFVGERVWVTSPTDGQPIAFGLIGPSTF